VDAGDELTACRLTTDVQRAAEGELFRPDGEYLHRVARRDGQGRVGGTRVYDDDSHILNGLLHDAADSRLMCCSSL
jgi:hypothetical protein